MAILDQKPIRVPEPSIAGITIDSGTLDSARFRDVKLNSQGDAIALQRTDWENLSPAIFSYSSPTEIAIDGIRPSDFFQIGDKIRIEQSDTLKYFYITLVDTDSIIVSAGDDYAVTNESIDLFSFTRYPSPSGFPSKFSYTAAILSGTFQNQTLYFSMDGEYVYISGFCSIITGVIGGSGTPSVRIGYPFDLRSNTSDNLVTFLQYGESTGASGSTDFGDFITRLEAGSGNTTQEYFYVSRVDGYTFAYNSGSGDLLNLSLGFSYTY